MSFFRALERMAQNVEQGMQPLAMPDHPCVACQTPMQYRGAHALRTGGLGRGMGIGMDVLLGGRDEQLTNTATEQNIVVHVFACASCGRLEFVNDPRKGF